MKSPLLPLCAKLASRMGGGLVTNRVGYHAGLLCHPPSGSRSPATSRPFRVNRRGAKTLVPSKLTMRMIHARCPPQPALAVSVPLLIWWLSPLTPSRMSFAGHCQHPMSWLQYVDANRCVISSVSVSFKWALRRPAAWKHCVKLCSEDSPTDARSG